MNKNTASNSQARIAISVFLAGLVACNAFAMCSDVMSSLLFVGIGGYFSVALLVIVFLLWLNLYLCGGKTLNPFDLEKSYYYEKFDQKFPNHAIEHKQEFKKFVKQWLRLAELRHELVRIRQKQAVGKRLDYNRVVEKLIAKWRRDYQVKDDPYDQFRCIANVYQQVISEKREGLLVEYYRFKDEDFHLDIMQRIFQDMELNTEWLEILKVRESSIFKPRYILLGVSTLALANVLINGLAMFGGASGVMHTIGLLCGVQFPVIITQIIALIFLCAGSYASYQLTRPMIRHFGYDLELYFQDMRHFHKKFSWLNVLAALMAFFSAIASATFAMYNTPLVRMLPVAMAGCAPFMQGFGFIIAFFSVFSLYFVSVSSKFRDWSREKITGFQFDRLLMPLLVIAASVVLDFGWFPAYLHGVLELLVVLEVAHERYGLKGVLFAISLFGSFAFCLTSFHQICVLFHPGPMMLVLSSVVTIFQFATFAVTFYYGCCRAFSVDSIQVSQTSLPESSDALQQHYQGLGVSVPDSACTSKETLSLESLNSGEGVKGRQSGKDIDKQLRG